MNTLPKYTYIKWKYCHAITVTVEIFLLKGPSLLNSLWAKVQLISLSSFCTFATSEHQVPWRWCSPTVTYIFLPPGRWPPPNGLHSIIFVPWKVATFQRSPVYTNPSRDTTLTRTRIRFLRSNQTDRLHTHKINHLWLDNIICITKYHLKNNL